MGGWGDGDRGVLVLPSGRRVRGRALRPVPGSGRRAEFTVLLQRHDPRPLPWSGTWIHWPHFGLPRDMDAALDVLAGALRRSSTERVELAVPGGRRGRAGTALACLAVLDGLPAPEAVRLVRAHYDDQAIETPWQRWFVGRVGRAIRSRPSP